MNRIEYMIGKIDEKLAQLTEHIADIDERINVALFINEDATELQIERDKWDDERDRWLDRRYRLQTKL